MSFNEDARVKIPAILHLARLGYENNSPEPLEGAFYPSPSMLGLIVEQFAKLHHLPLTPESTRFINALVMQEYLDEFNGQQPACTADFCTAAWQATERWLQPACLGGARFFSFSDPSL
ncbi:MAG: hypothetical protein K9N23_16235 [Akkermansiaceae bacterium]|nr:hypothetical protein [Akkermansiaceae bacterium]